MESVLIAAAKEKSAATLGDLVRGRYRRAELSGAASGAAARRMLLERRYDLVVISAPLADEAGVELAAKAAEDPTVGVLLIARAEYVEAIDAQVGDRGVFVLEKPIQRAVFHSALRLTAVSLRRAAALEAEAARLRGKIEDLKVIGRAKCALMESRTLSEQEAHRYIEKQAMDLRLSRRQVAEELLRAYGYER